MPLLPEELASHRVRRLGLPDQPHFRRRLLPQASRKRVAAWGQPTVGKQDKPKPVLGHPRCERRLGAPGQHLERGAVGNGSEEVAGLLQLQFRFLPDGDVVRTLPAGPAPSRGPCLRREGHDRQLAPRVGQFGGLTQSRRACVAALENDCNPSGRTGTGAAVYRAFHQSCAEPRHTGHVTRAPRLA